MSPIESSNYPQLRKTLADKQGVGYWRSLAELAETPEYRDMAGKEFPDVLHFWNAPASRRRVLKLLGASMALAGLTGCMRQPEEDIVPYVRMPEYLVPGKARYYATSALLGGYAHGLLAESHEGRPTKVEGNPEHPATLGACDAISQASVLSLYDPDRSATVRDRGTPVDFGMFLAAVQKKQQHWDRTRGKGLCLLTETLTSPSERAAIEKLLERWPEARWFAHEPVSREAVYAGSRLLFGKALEPHYRFDKARVVLSLDADFLQGQPGFLRYARDLMALRRPRDNPGGLSRLYALESTPGITGATADHRRALTYAEVETATWQLASALGIESTTEGEPVLDEGWIRALADDLQKHPGQVVIVPGDQQPAAVHALAHGMNERLGAFGNTVVWSEPIPATAEAPGIVALTEAIRAGDVDSLVVCAANPVYSAPADLQFDKAFGQVPWRAHWGLYRDETARLAHWHIPAAHALEAWADARSYDGTISLIQPLIRPLRSGRTALEFWHALEKGVPGEPRDLLQSYWARRQPGPDFTAFWRQSLHDGLVADTAAPVLSPTPRMNWPQALPQPTEPAEGLTLQFRPDPALWDGRHANNGWLQEMPRPLTTLTWDNALLISPALAEDYDLAEGDVVVLATATGSVRVPVFVLPGQPRRAMTLSLGHGRDAAGRVAQAIGTNAFALRSSNRLWSAPATIEKTGAHRDLAVIQNHHNIEGRDMIRAASWEDYQDHPDFAKGHAPELSLYPEPSPGQWEGEHAWGMAVDLSACIGCNGCVTACQSENNIPVVGPEEVSRGHDLHWLRVDRYFSGHLDAPGITFQPVPCMHCENAPCEYVCPVGATQHSADGLNQMLYQRCIGTRYCSQNCPYKVRRFNWFDYTGENAPYPAEPAVQNPDVTVRSRGVMEKCTYCVQRITQVRRRAESEQRDIIDGELKTACQQACPTEAIVFGDLADTTSKVSRLKSHPLNYAMLGHLNTRPRTTYLAAVHNPNPALDPGEEDG
jgi:molybdopterin-containing oxidoreductase family iron-sulfur binding subunit